jgi:hypothetical protein
MSVWDEEFGKEWAVSPRIMDLVRRGVLEESSWHNDVSPSFVARLRDGRLLRFWIEHPNESRRESGSPYRYLLVVQKDFGDPPDEVILETDDLNRALYATGDTVTKRGRGGLRLLP